MATFPVDPSEIFSVTAPNRFLEINYLVILLNTISKSMLKFVFDQKY